MVKKKRKPHTFVMDEATANFASLQGDAPITEESKKHFKRFKEEYENAKSKKAQDL